MATDNGPPWTPERYYEIDHCLVRKCWRSRVIDITTDPHTNINTDHYMMTVEIRQTLKTKVDTQYEQPLKNVSIPEGSEEDIPKSFNNNISEQLTKIKTEQRREITMVDLCAAMDKVARENLQFKEPLKKRTSCHPELQPIIDARLQATKNYDYEGVKSITKDLNKKARQIRTTTTNKHF